MDDRGDVTFRVHFRLTEGSIKRDVRVFIKLVGKAIIVDKVPVKHIEFGGR